MFYFASTLMAMAAMIAGALLLIAGAVVGRAALTMIAVARASRRWPTSRGRVVRSEIRENRAFIRYAYPVAGEEYEGRDVAAGDWPYQTARTVARRVQRYPSGAQVTVYYDPGDPARVAILRPGLSFDVLYLPVVASLLVLIAIALLSWSVSTLLFR
jgi:hypothetical protein